MKSVNYQFTLTDKYVSSWGYIEGVRELLQNAYDYGDYDISFDGDEMYIKNFNDSLPIKTLLMGYGTKQSDKNSIGGFGEGFVLALLVLIRQGLDVTIENAHDRWEPGFVNSKTFDERVFNIKVTKDVSESDDFCVIIGGLSPEQVSCIQREFLGLQGDYSAIKTQYGEILTDPEQKGKMYVEGLPITTDRDFDYGYNFKAEFVVLDRDRKDINHKELKKITAMAIVSMEEDDFDFVDTVVESGKDDLDSLVHNDIDIPETFVNKYSNHLRDKFKVYDKSVVTTKSDEKIIQELTEMGEDVVTVDRKIYADIINKTSQYSADKYKEASESVHSRSRVDDAWWYYNYSDYKKFKEWFAKYGEDISDEGREVFLDLLEGIEPTYFELISDKVKEDIV